MLNIFVFVVCFGGIKKGSAFCTPFDQLSMPVASVGVKNPQRRNVGGNLNMKRTNNFILKRNRPYQPYFL
jgi:hypothetical protein